jgi:hypothetical protein
MTLQTNSWKFGEYRNKYIRKFPKFDVQIFLNPIVVHGNRPRSCYMMVMPPSNADGASFHLNMGWMSVVDIVWYKLFGSIVKKLLMNKICTIEDVE